MNQPSSTNQTITNSLWSWRVFGESPLNVVLTMRAAEAVRAAMIRNCQHQFETENLPVCLHGGDPSSPQHSHAYWLPEDRDGDGWLDHITVSASGGFCDRAHELLYTLKRVRIDGSGWFDLEPAQGLEEDFGPCRSWLSTTPFVGPRHAWRGAPHRKKAGETASKQLAREIGRLPDISKVRIREIDGRGLPSTSAFRIGLRARKGPAFPVKGYFAIEFEEAVKGPLALGFGAHFGLGQFRPFYAGR